MNRIRSFMAAAAVAVIGVGTMAAPAQAQTTPTPVIEYSSQGGFVLFNFNMKIYSTGFTVAQMTSPRQQGESLYLYDYLTRTQLASFKAALDRARFTTLPGVVRTAHMIADLPDRVVKYRGRTVRFTSMGSPSAPIATATFIRAITLLGNNFGRIADEPIVKYEAAGGLAGMHEELTISRSGQCHFWASYRSGPRAPKDGVIDFATLNALKRAITAANWTGLPDFFPRNTMIMDGMDYSVSISDAHDHVKAVASSTGAHETNGFKAVTAKIYDIIQQINR